jgi:hypothetical protein
MLVARRSVVVPANEAVQSGASTTPPAGTLIVKFKVEAESVPVTVPFV